MDVMSSPWESALPVAQEKNEHSYSVSRTFKMKQNHSLLMFQAIKLRLFKAHMAEGEA